MTALIIRSKGISIRCRTGIAVAVIFFSAGYIARETSSARQKCRYYPPLGPSVFDCLRQTIQRLPDRFSQFAGRLAAWLACWPICEDGLARHNETPAVVMPRRMRG